MSERQTFKMGDEVTWRSQAGGFETQKVGTVVEIIPAGQRPTGLKGAGGPRNHESYIIKATSTDGAQGKKTDVYWPRVNNLSLARVAMSDGPPFDAATATGMYDRDA